MIIDEGHNIEPQLLDFVTFTVSDKHLRKHKIKLKEFDSPYDYALWFDEIDFGPKIDLSIKAADLAGDIDTVEELMNLRHRYDVFMQHLTNSEFEWVSDYKITTLKGKGGGQGFQFASVSIKPVFITGFAHKLLLNYGSKVLIMSATILDVDMLCSSLGIDRDRVSAIRMRNRFPVEKRPIYFRPAARMTGGKAKMGEWGPKLVRAVGDIIEQYDGERGIIHTHNHAIAQMLLNDSARKIKDRLLYQNNFPNKTAMLAAHAAKEGSVIVAPAMHEGINLVDGLSRFQVICKIPYANFFDNPQLKRRVELDRRYYTWLTALKLVQSYGRSIRSEEDWADTYIIDEAFNKFQADAGRMLPRWFLDALEEA